MNDLVKKLQDQAPDMVKNNTGALLGALIGYLLSDKLSENEEITNALLGGLVGAFIDDKKKGGK